MSALKLVYDKIYFYPLLISKLKIKKIHNYAYF